MKQLIIVAGIAFLASCNNKSKAPADTKPVRDTTIQVCDFGIRPEQFNTVKRQPADDEFISKNRPVRPTKPPKVPPPPATQAGVILLDFDGCLVSNTSWNFSGDINCANANLSAAAMQTIYDSAVSKYSPFKITITTDEAVYNAAPWTRRIRVIYTETWEWYGRAGGVSFVGSFTWGDNTPCFVFTSLLNYNVKYILEAGVHEAGHSLGLYHQSTYDSIPTFPGSKVSEYSYGCCGRAPIMGCSYYQNMSSWVDGWNGYKLFVKERDVIAGVVGYK